MLTRRDMGRFLYRLALRAFAIGWAIMWYGIEVGRASSIAFVTLAQGAQSGIVHPAQRVIKTPREWVALWQQHIAQHLSQPSPPPVEFSSEMIVGIFLGQRPTGGYAVEISRIVQEGQAVKVYYQETAPPPGTFVTQALTQPFHIVKLKRLELPLFFQRE